MKMPTLSNLSTVIFAILPLILSSSIALACGGLFCDNNLPVNQAAERILFAPDPVEDLMHMHVLITYQGPPENFGWLLPVPPGTQFGLSRPALFSELDTRYAPTFRLNRISAEYCPQERGDSSLSFAQADNEAGVQEEEEVQVTSQSQVGPYDQVTLRAETVDALVEWLEENQYQVPPNATETLAPYLTEYEFLAIKLASGQESGDIQPILLNFSGHLATIPLRPTAVASEPDMGVIVHLLGPARAIPSNYQLVELNLAALDWFNPSQHYSQLVSHAVDESDDGHGFVTDFAGQHEFPVEEIAPTVSASLVLAMEEVRNSESLYEVLGYLLADIVQTDLTQVLLSALPLSREENQTLIELATSGQAISSVEVGLLIHDENGESFDVDGAAIAQALTIYNHGGLSIQRAFQVNPYLTRLYTTLNASEMSVDTSFDFNPDLDNVDNNRVADLYLDCNGRSDYIVTPDGLEVDLSLDREIIERQNGQSVRGVDTIGAAMIVRSMSAGQSEVIIDQRETLANTYKLKRPTADGFFGCQQPTHKTNAPFDSASHVIFGLLIISLMMRRHRHI